jgi:ferric-dicitrate binding protein FerR (iron transport regulator)
MTIIEGHFCVPRRGLACAGRRGCRVSLIQINRWRVEPQCLVKPRRTAQRHRGAWREQWREARDQPLHDLVAAGNRCGFGLDNG